MTRREIRLAAEKFLNEHAPNRGLPVDIEAIADIKLGIEVRPLPGLYRAFGRNGILLSSGKVIAVDNDDYESYQTRFRFTLAHEIGHIVLHEDYVEAVSLDDVAQAWKQYADLPPEDMAEMERDANIFAGFVLVPNRELRQQLEVVRQKILSEHRVDINGKGTEVRDGVAKAMADAFDVSPNVVGRRLEEEGLP